MHDGNRSNGTLIGATVGFVGCGGVATRLRELLAPFDVRALGFDPPLGQDLLRSRGFELAALGTIASEADVVFVLAAPTTANRGLVDAELLATLTHDQSIVLLSRASVVDFEALTRHALAGDFRVAVDVYPSEPLASDHPIRRAGASVLTPHLAGALPGALFEIGRSVVDDLDAIETGGPPRAMQYLDATNFDGLVQ